jgi:hypothetical protein
MTTCTLLINRLRLPGDQGSTVRHEVFAVRVMHGVTTRAANAASRVIALDAPNMRLLVAMAAEAYFVRARDRQLRRVYDFFRRNSLNVRACRAVTPFACMVFPASLLIEINGFMRVLLKGIENIFVAALADFGANVGFGTGGRSRGRRLGFGLLTSCGSRGECE